jgi:uncharacterized sulfatase
MEGSPREIYTDNYPLDRGKISAMEGGTRVPLIIVGPGIEAGIQSDVMINGLDFYPTILSLTGVNRPKDKNLDGCDLAPLLKQDPTDPKLVRHPDGRVRNTMVWHFPHGVAQESTIRVDGYKLVRNYDHVNNPSSPELELFELYKSEGGQQVRVDIEEANNLASSIPEKAQAMDQRLTEILTEMKASYPYYNPDYQHSLPGKELVPEIVSHGRDGKVVEFNYRENGAKVIRANLIYTLNGGHKYEEWYQTEAKLIPGNRVTVRLPRKTTHYYINLIDENNFLVSYPTPEDQITKNKTRSPYSKTALKIEN